MDQVRITNSIGQTLTYAVGRIAGIDTTEDNWWLSPDKREFLRLCNQEQ